MRCHDDAIISMLKNDPDMAGEYLRAAFNERDEEGGEAAFLMALRHVVQAQRGMSEIVKKTSGIQFHQITGNTA
ncbi:MAG: hypothetical protein CMH98_15155 [Oceanospirillaceae bacterium]|nr:hypothetical protein [Oceanospirillaceae bacterium]